MKLQWLHSDSKRAVSLEKEPLKYGLRLAESGHVTRAPPQFHVKFYNIKDSSIFKTNNTYILEIGKKLTIHFSKTRGKKSLRFTQNHNLS